MAIGTGAAILAGTLGSAAIGGIAANKAAKAAKPDTIPYNPTDPYAEADKAMSWNMARAGDAEALISRSNKYSQDEALSLLERAMPGYSRLAQALTSQATQKAENPYSVPKDVEQNLIRLANERGVNLGTRGQFNDFSVLRDFGVNSMQYGESNIQQASQILGMLYNTTPRINPLSPTSLWMNPQFATQLAVDQNMAQHGVAQGAANASAAAEAQKWSTYGTLASNAIMGLGGWYSGAAGASGAVGSSGVNKTTPPRPIE